VAAGSQAKYKLAEDAAANKLSADFQMRALLATISDD
jgi:hypothetical protein